MAKCAFWMLGGLTIYAFISFVVITALSVLQVYLHKGWMLIVPCPSDHYCWIGYILGIANYVLGFGNIMLSLFVVGLDRPYKFTTTDKVPALGKNYVGAFH